MLPKDYLAYRFSGVHATDVSDASGMLLFDVKNRCWSEEMLEICGISKDCMARVFESYECIGHLTEEAAENWGLQQIRQSLREPGTMRRQQSARERSVTEAVTFHWVQAVQFYFKHDIWC